MTTNIQTNLSELQERNREKATRVTLSNGIDGYTFTPKALDTVTTDNFKAGALAVIESIQEVGGIGWSVDDYLDHLTTLEATLKDLTPTLQDQNGHKINSDGSLCYDAKCRHCVRKDVIRE